MSNAEIFRAVKEIQGICDSTTWRVVENCNIPALLRVYYSYEYVIYTGE